MKNANFLWSDDSSNSLDWYIDKNHAMIVARHFVKYTTETKGHYVKIILSMQLSIQLSILCLIENKTWHDPYDRPQ